MGSIEKMLSAKYNRITYWSENHEENTTAYDSLEKANDAFEKLLQSVTAKYPASIKYHFCVFDSSNLSVAGSDDGQFRIYSWDTYTGGTMHVFATVYQFAFKNKTFSLKGYSGDEGGSWYDSIYTISTAHKNYYLAVYHSVFSSRDKNVGIKVFSIDKGKLNTKTKLIKTGSGLQNTIDVEFDVPALQSEDYPEIKYDRTTKTIFLPLLAADGKLTQKTIAYRFMTDHFEKVKK